MRTILTACLLLLASPAVADDLIATYNFETWWYVSGGPNPNPHIYVTTWYRGPRADVPVLPVGEPSLVDDFVLADYDRSIYGGPGLLFNYADLRLGDSYFASPPPLSPFSDDDFRRVTAIEITVDRFEPGCDMDDGFCHPLRFLEFTARLYAPSLVPEPSAALLLVIAGLLAGAAFRRRLS